MSKLLIKPKHGTGRVTHVTPETAGWTYVGFDLHKLASGGKAEGGLPDREVCLVIVSGKARISVDGIDLAMTRYNGSVDDKEKPQPVKDQPK